MKEIRQRIYDRPCHWTQCTTCDAQPQLHLIGQEKCKPLSRSFQNRTDSFFAICKEEHRFFFLIGWRGQDRAMVDRRRARQRLKGFLLRLGRRYTGKGNWSEAHLRYLATIKLSHAA